MLVWTEASGNPFHIDSNKEVLNEHHMRVASETIYHGVHHMFQEDNANGVRKQPIFRNPTFLGTLFSWPLFVSDQVVVDNITPPLSREGLLPAVLEDHDSSSGVPTPKTFGQCCWGSTYGLQNGLSSSPGASFTRLKLPCV